MMDLSCPGSPNCVSTKATDEQHGIAPLTFSGEPAAEWARLKKITLEQPRTKLVVDEPAHMHVEFKTMILRFVDDVHFVMDEPNKTIHFRSASRVGKSDLGVNRKRMENIRSQFSLSK
jgi:uncharacterized protein (DUF1499 family)